MGWDKENYSKSTKAIRKELAIHIKKCLVLNDGELPDSVVVEEARAYINDKYGKGWREQWVKS